MATEVEAREARFNKGTRDAARAALTGRRRGLWSLLPFLGPAFIASVAYMDPGNFATNIQGGARYGYRLLWVVVFANLTAMLFQGLSAKLGIVTGRNLAELSRELLPRRLSLAMWVVSEVGAMATDLAEFLGATIALNLLFGIPLLAGALVTGVGTYLILLLERYGFRPIEAVIAVLIGVVAAAYVVETFFAAPNWGNVARGALVPWIGDSGSVLLAVGIVGATVMPHAIYVHSGLTQERIEARTPAERRRLIRFSHVDVLVALTLAGLINLAMMYMAAATFHPAHSAVADLTTAERTLAPLLGGASALVFAISLLASGLSSSAVGTLAGQVIMQGFVDFPIPLWVRRLVTMAPTLVVIAIGVNATEALVLSQVVLSLVLPVPVIALVAFGRRRSLMGEFANSGLTTAIAALAAAAIVVLNAILLGVTVLGR